MRHGSCAFMKAEFPHPTKVRSKVPKNSAVTAWSLGRFFGGWNISNMADCKIYKTPWCNHPKNIIWKRDISPSFIYITLGAIHVRITWESGKPQDMASWVQLWFDHQHGNTFVESVSILGPEWNWPLSLHPSDPKWRFSTFSTCPRKPCGWQSFKSMSFFSGLYSYPAATAGRHIWVLRHPHFLASNMVIIHQDGLNTSFIYASIIMQLTLFKHIIP